MTMIKKISIVVMVAYIQYYNFNFNLGKSIFTKEKQTHKFFRYAIKITVHYSISLIQYWKLLLMPVAANYQPVWEMVEKKKVLRTSFEWMCDIVSWKMDIYSISIYWKSWMSLTRFSGSYLSSVYKHE